MKRCIACKQLLGKSNFDISTRSADGLMVRCRLCNKIHRDKERDRYSENPEYRKSKAEYHNKKAGDPSYLRKRAKHERDRYSSDLEYKNAKAEYHQKKAEDPDFLEKRARHERRRYSEDIEYKQTKSEYKMELYRNDRKHRVDHNFSCQIRQSLAQGKSGQSWESLVGYSLNDLINHIEMLFEEGMSWDNYGTWHIDHRVPRTWFKYESTDDPAFKECWALLNLQPKWGKENIQKGNRFAD